MKKTCAGSGRMGASRTKNPIEHHADQDIIRSETETGGRQRNSTIQGTSCGKGFRSTPRSEFLRGIQFSHRFRCTTHGPRHFCLARTEPSSTVFKKACLNAAQLKDIRLELSDCSKTTSTDSSSRQRNRTKGYARQSLVVDGCITDTQGTDELPSS